MGKIEIGGYYLEGDKEGFEIYQMGEVLDKKGLPTGRIAKKNKKWHPTLESACVRLLTLLVSTSHIPTVKELKSSIEKAKNEIIEVVRNG